MTGASILKGIFISLTILLTAGCAQQGAPTGGPVDEDPPEVVKTDPPNYSTNFDAQKIEIEFNEYLDMGNFTQELIVSPPMEEKPIVKLRNKILIIEFEEELREEATYTFNFGEGIADLNERNVLLNYEYVFSTGEELDSLSVKGTLKNAFDLTTPESPILVMLYNDLNDSLPLTDIPYYVGRADKEGNFAVNNLRKGIYKLFVLKDGNNNFLFDLPNENIAFLDSSLLVDGNYFTDLLFESGMADSSDLQPDTTSFEVDTVGLSPDSVIMVLDSIQQLKDSLELLKPDFNSVYIDLYMFTEEPLNRYITENKREEREIMNLVFNIPVTDSFHFSPFYPDTLSSEDFIPEFGMNRDTLGIWTADSMVAALDTILMALRYTTVDTMQKFVTVNDTLTFVYRERATKRGSSSDKSAEGESGMKIKTVRNNGKQHFNKPLFFTLERPVGKIDPSKFEFYEVPDTVDIPVKFEPVIDTTHLRRVKIDYPWKEEESYRMVLYPGAIEDVYGAINDTINHKFSVKPLTEYGKLILNLEQVNDTVIIQVIKGKNIVRSRTITSSGMYEFDFLSPDTYRVKLVHDRNNNGKWDSGRYIKNLQPEKVEFLPKDIKLRANWDHTMDYIMGTNNSPPHGADEGSEDADREENNDREEGTVRGRGVSF